MNQEIKTYQNAVDIIKTAILQSQARAAKAVNQEQLALYFGIGRYISENTRNNGWGTGVLKQISESLRLELPGLRGFSETNLKDMRMFYEAWKNIESYSSVATDELENFQSVTTDNRWQIPDNEQHIIRQLQLTNYTEFPLAEFLSISFTHHIAIINNAKDFDERLFYIRFCHNCKPTTEELPGIIKKQDAIFRDLGLFLFMYLGDGQNLADTLRLTYDDWYFATHGKQLRFFRHKTQERNASASEVIFPVTDELKKIIDKYGNEPVLGERVFPIMSKSITADQEIWVIQRYNRYIREHMAIVSEILGMQERLTSTWARHSFATNLNNSNNVPYKYICDSMGHSSSGDITSKYIGAYPLKRMLEYNAYLLDENGGKSSSAVLLEQLQGLSEAEQKEILDALSKSIK